jgi:predicted MFS family arabinose efflux permease
LPTSAETLAGRIHHECLRRTLAHANVAAAASVALTWIVTPNVVVTLALFGFAAVVVAARTVVGTAHGFVVAGERKLEVGAARSAITHAGYLAGSFVGGAAPGIGGHSAVGFVFGLLFLGATIPYLSAWHAHCPRSGPLSLVSARRQPQNA